MRAASAHCNRSRMHRATMRAAVSGAGATGRRVDRARPVRTRVRRCRAARAGVVLALFLIRVEDWRQPDQTDLHDREVLEWAGLSDTG